MATISYGCMKSLQALAGSNERNGDFLGSPGCFESLPEVASNGAQKYSVVCISHHQDLGIEPSPVSGQIGLVVA